MTRSRVLEGTAVHTHTSTDKIVGVATPTPTDNSPRQLFLSQTFFVSKKACGAKMVNLHSHMWFVDRRADDGIYIYFHASGILLQRKKRRCCVRYFKIQAEKRSIKQSRRANDMTCKNPSSPEVYQPPGV